MLTKYILEIGSQEYELRPNDLKNWDQIQCTYKREDFGGVMRSFMSKFEFVNDAYRLLMEEYDNKGYKAKAHVTMYVINNRWEYVPEFGCELDFSSLQYNEYVLSISAIDQSVSSIIKANKGTKYEFTLGDDVIVNGMDFLFDRLMMTETATYEITDGESQEDGSLNGSYKTSNNGRIMFGSVGQELCIGGFVQPNDDQVCGDGYLFKALKSTTVKVDYSIDVSRLKGCAALVLMKNDTQIRSLHRTVASNNPWLVTDFNDISEVMQFIHSDPYRSHDWATEDWRGVWVTVKGIVWDVQWNGGNEFVNTGKTKAQYLSSVEADSFDLSVNSGDVVWIKFNSDVNREFSINSSIIKFSWTARGPVVPITCISPSDLLERILYKMGVYMDCYISNYDNRIRNTILLSAESIRDIPNAKIYASFNDFCNWMETVFGYVYYIDEENAILEFKHRNEIFRSDAPIIDIPNIRDVEYTIDKSVLYSSVVIGYDKREYEGVNGRDEFNMNISYTTDYTNDGKKFELKSPFRADSYGIEFLCEKRGQDTTDNASDKDVFFVTAVDSGGYYKPNRSSDIQNSITGTLINGEFSPIRCIEANREIISIMANSLHLAFASTEGNANILIDNERISDDLWLEDCEMLTPGELKFTSDSLMLPGDANSIFRVRTNDYIYLGYLKEVSFKYGKPERAEYKIMIKHKQPCS